MEGLLHSPIETEMSISLCSDEGIEFHGETFVPNATLAFFQFKMSHAFPVATVYGTGLHPSVIAKSFKSLMGQNVNYEHKIQAYRPPEEQDGDDRIIGAIRAVHFPPMPAGGWKMTAAANSPAITGIASVFKQAKGMARVLGGQATGRDTHSVSMEVLWPFDQAGFALATNGKEPLIGYKPSDSQEAMYASDMLVNGYEFVPVEKAPEELVGTFSKKRMRIVATYKGRKVFAMMGGLSNPVHYTGAGVVRHQAEPPAKIMRLAASDDRSNPLGSVADSLASAFQSLVQKH